MNQNSEGFVIKQDAWAVCLVITVCNGHGDYSDEIMKIQSVFTKKEHADAVIKKMGPGAMVVPVDLYISIDPAAAI